MTEKYELVDVDTRNLIPGDIIHCHAPMQHADLNEGKYGGTHALAFFTREEDARLYGKGKDCMGSDCSVKQFSLVVTGGRELVVLGKTVCLFDGLRALTPKTKALRKVSKVLTNEEMELLGL